MQDKLFMGISNQEPYAKAFRFHKQFKEYSWIDEVSTY
jgi:hypothetical protein